MDVSNGPSLRLRGGVNNNSDNKKNELNMCTSVMSPETQRLLPPTSETIMTKPFPIRDDAEELESDVDVSEEDSASSVEEELSEEEQQFISDAE